MTPAGVKLKEFPRTFHEIFDFLATKPRSRYVAWNMDFDARACLHPNFLPWHALEFLGLYGRLSHGKYSFKYTPKKFLEVRDNTGRGFLLFDLAQFYGCSLRAAAEKLGPEFQKQEIPKSWYGEIDKCLKDHRREKILAYARRDVESVQALTARLLNSLSALKIRPKRLSSCASLARLRYGKTLARTRAPDYLNRIFERAFYGGRIECATLGTVRDVALYDINSAYPSEIAKLKDPTKGRHSQTRDWKYQGPADYGAYLIEAEIPLSLAFGPLAVRDRGQILFPVGAIRTWAGVDALDALRRYKIPFKVRYAYEIFDCPPECLFNDMGEMFAARRDSLAGLAIKLTINSLYGLTAEATNYLSQDVLGAREIHGQKHQSRLKYGRLTNFLFAAKITERVRLRLWELSIKYKPGEIHFCATDSLLLSRDVPFRDEVGIGLGEWSFKGEFPRAVVLGCGRYRLESRDGTTLDHLRGFPVRPEFFEKLARTKRARTRISTLDTRSMRQWATDTFAADYNVLSPSWRYLEVTDDKRYWPKKLPRIMDYFSQSIISEPWIFRRPTPVKKPK